MILRPYQSTDLERIRTEYRGGHRAVLYVAPTGSGKTVLFAAVSHGAAEKGKRVLVICHRVELVDQIVAALETEGMTPSVIAAGYPKRTWQVSVAMIQTLVRRLDTIPEPDLIVVDEAHHSTAATYTKVLAKWPNARVLGVTATPRRPSGDGLGTIYQSMVIGPSTAELTAMGYLSPARIFAPPTVDIAGLHIRAGEYVQTEVAERVGKPSVTGSAVEHYRKLADGKRAVCFCYSIEHSKSMAAAFRDAGIAAVHLDGLMSREIRHDVICEFRVDLIKILCSVDVASEGLDIPGIECGILLRPTASEIIHLQQIGRCLRTSPGKSEAILLDHVGNTAMHGLPTEDREWSLDGARERKGKLKPSVSVKVCPSCFAAQRAGRSACVVCFKPFPVDAREVEEREGELVEIRARRQAKMEQARAETLEELREVGRQRGYKHGWADRIYAARKAKRRSA